MVIVLASEDTSPSDWIIGGHNTQPQVYLSVLEMIMNLLISFALFEGVVIKFWRELLGGCTVSITSTLFKPVHVFNTTNFPSSRPYMTYTSPLSSYQLSDERSDFGLM